MWIGCLIILCVFILLLCLILGGIHEDYLKYNIPIKEEKQRIDKALKEKELLLNAEIQKESIKNDSNIKFLEGQLKAYKEVIDKFKMNS